MSSISGKDLSIGSHRHRMAGDVFVVAMKAVVYYTPGSPDVLQCEEVDKPSPRDNEVLIKVLAAAVNPLDSAELRGMPYLVRLLLGLNAPTATHPARPGVDLAGQVEAVGKAAARFKPGDEVFGLCISNPQASGVKVWVHDQGAFAEYVCAPEAALSIKPSNVTFEQAAAIPVAAITALQGLRDKGHIRPRQNVVINGASGGVGSCAVQIAKSFGATVTGVCSTRNVDMVRSCGADHVVDYSQQDFTSSAGRYDLIFDCVGNHPLTAYERVLKPNGICVMAGEMTGRSPLGIMARLMTALILSFTTSHKFTTFLAKPKQDDLNLLRDLMETGKLKPIIDRSYELSEVPEAIRYLETKHARGKVVIKVASGSNS